MLEDEAHRMERTAERVVIGGGGLAGLSAAKRLVDAGY